MTGANEPQRTCVGCRRQAPASELLRLTAPDGVIVIGRNEPGRGAWVCSIDCYDRATKKNALERALRRPLSSAEVEAARARLVTAQKRDGLRFGHEEDPGLRAGT